MSIELFQANNLTVLKTMCSQNLGGVNLIYADMMFDNLDFEWTDWCRKVLDDTGSLFVHTDWRSVAELKVYLDALFGKECFVNWIIWPYDWGGRSKRRFARKHDDILWYSKTDEYKFYPDRVSIPKKTANTGFNPSGRTDKIPTDVWSDIGNFHTMSKERIKLPDGTGFVWQKPLAILDRIILSTTDVNDIVLDPFMGSGTTGVSAINHNRNFIGIDNDRYAFATAKKRLREVLGETEQHDNNKENEETNI